MIFSSYKLKREHIIFYSWFFMMCPMKNLCIDDFDCILLCGVDMWKSNCSLSLYVFVPLWYYQIFSKTNRKIPLNLNELADDFTKEAHCRFIEAYSGDIKCVNCMIELSTYLLGFNNFMSFPSTAIELNVNGNWWKVCVQMFYDAVKKERERKQGNGRPGSNNECLQSTECKMLDPICGQWARLHKHYCIRLANNMIRSTFKSLKPMFWHRNLSGHRKEVRVHNIHSPPIMLM